MQLQYHNKVASKLPEGGVAMMMKKNFAGIKTTALSRFGSGKSFAVPKAALRLTISMKIFSGFMIVIAMVTVINIFTYFKVDELSRAAQEIMDKNLAEIVLVEELAVDVANETVAMRRFGFTGDLADVAAFDYHRQFGDSKISQLENTLPTEKAKAILQTLKKEKAEFDTIAAKSIEARRLDNAALAAVYMQQASKPSEDAIAATKELVSAVKEKIKEESEENSKKAGQVQMLLVIVNLLTVAVSLVTSFFVSRGISRPVRVIAAAATEVAGGNLALADITTQSSDEISHLGEAFNQMKSNLRSLIQKVARSAEQVADSAQQLTDSADQSAQAGNQVASAIGSVAQSAGQQLQSVDDSAVVVQQMAAGIQQIAVNADAVAGKSAKAAETASVGGKAVEKAIQQMAQIEHTVNASAEVVAELGARSKEIGQIVETIAGIAGQTNLLALNAAIEAARAGEQGRGFAVVAEEVRKLAEQSQEAAKQIAGLIGRIQSDTNKAVEAMAEGTKDVRTGAEVVDTTGEAFRAIEAMVLEVSGQITEITEAIRQVAGGSQTMVASIQDIEALSKRVSEETQSVSAATEEQSASTEEIAASSQALAKLAQDLQDEVSKFRV